MINLILRSFENELLNEVYIKEKFNIRLKMFPFKIFKSRTIFLKYGYLGLLFLYIFCFAKPLIDSFFFIFHKRVKGIDEPLMIVTADISSPLQCSIEEEFNKSFKFLDRGDIAKFYSSKLGILKRLVFISHVIISYFLIIFSRIKNKSFSIFSLFDLFEVCVLISLIKESNNKNFPIGSDDHLQRYSFLISSLADQSFILQHGFIDPPKDTIILKNINVLFCFDSVFVKSFKSFIEKIEKVILLKHGLDIQDCNFETDKPVVFLASSFPFIEQELEFLINNANTLNDCYVVIKPHPSHMYDERIHLLSSLCQIFYKESYHPKCDLMISYNSFLNYHYKLVNIPTFSIKNEDLKTFKDSLRHMLNI